jgi:hypothetical protein
MNEFTITNTPVKTQNPNDIREAISKWARLDRVLVNDGFHPERHRTPKFQKNAVFVRWMNCRERVLGYNVLRVENKDGAVEVLSLLIGSAMSKLS